MAVAKLERHNLAGKSVSDMGHISSVFGIDFGDLGAAPHLSNVLV